MKIRVIDYVANLGGGVRFAAEMLRGLAEIPGLSLEVVSSGDALARYRALLGGMDVGFVDVPPSQAWRGRTLLAGVPGAGPLNWILRTDPNRILVSRRALEDCDVAWFPWVHRHRIPRRLARKVVGSLHDLIMIEFPQWFPGGGAAERETLASWLDSDARIAVSSRATEALLQRHFGIGPGRTSVIPLSGQHRVPARSPTTRAWPFTGREYLLCPANHSRHKNHEVLLAAAGAVAPRHPLVLTGDGTDIYRGQSLRSEELRHLAGRSGLVADETLFAIGYVDDPDYYAILEGAWAVVMPTLAEGGGSFPVWEALERGIPAVVSDIPVMREMMERVGGEVLWFDPRDPASLARALRELEGGYAQLKARALEQRVRLSRRGWREVAKDYAAIMGLHESPGGGRIETGQPEVLRVGPGLESALATFFEHLAATGVGERFHPHPFTRAEAEARCAHSGLDFYCVVVARGVVLGYGMLRGWDEGYDVPSLGIAIHADARGMGLGRTLMLHLHAEAQRRAAPRIRLKVYPDNTAAVNLYRSLGYDFEPSLERGQLVGFKRFQG